MSLPARWRRARRERRLLAMPPVRFCRALTWRGIEHVHDVLDAGHDIVHRLALDGHPRLARRALELFRPGEAVVAADEPLHSEGEVGIVELRAEMDTEGRVTLTWSVP